MSHECKEIDGDRNTEGIACLRGRNPLTYTHQHVVLRRRAALACYVQTKQPFHCAVRAQPHAVHHELAAASEGRRQHSASLTWYAIAGGRPDCICRSGVRALLA